MAKRSLMAVVKRDREETMKRSSSVREKEKQIETAVEEIIDTIENYFLAAPWVFIHGHDGSPGEYIMPNKLGSFQRFSWVDAWTEMLFPWVDSEEDIEIASQQSGFVLGVLVGAKMMGATREQLKEKARGFVLPAVRHVEWMARS